MSTPTETHVRLAAKLYEARNTVRLLLADKYRARMTELGKILQQAADSSGESVVEVATDLVKRAHLRGFEALTLMAAAVELVEPTPKGGH